MIDVVFGIWLCNVELPYLLVCASVAYEHRWLAHDMFGIAGPRLVCMACCICDLVWVFHASLEVHVWFVMVVMQSCLCWCCRVLYVAGGMLGRYGPWQACIGSWCSWIMAWHLEYSVCRFRSSWYYCKIVGIYSCFIALMTWLCMWFWLWFRTKLAAGKAHELQWLLYDSGGDATMWFECLFC